MSNTNHTPAPWYIDVRDKDNYDNGIITLRMGEGLDYQSVCTLYPTGADFETSLANAKLIAAGPELLENLIRIIDRIDEGGFGLNFPSAYERAKTAIKKATE